ncbi:MAG: 3-dehydroquinate synthase [Phycisphaerales bacterium]|nr:3-dehydroquinate synthase [Phycisphaerales bacterium]
MPHPLPDTVVRVHAGSREYDVVVGPGLLASVGERARGRIGGNRCLLAFDSGLPTPTVALAEGSLSKAGYRVARIAVRAEESQKSLATLGDTLAVLAEQMHERTDPVVALGGGIVGDLAGFAAAVWRRGVPVVQCPTTLLSMVDASVGGKTGVNLHAGGGLRKNMVGAFWQPRLVLADTDTLASLPDRHLRSGLAECLKHGLIAADLPNHRDPGLFEWTTSALPGLLRRDAGLLAELIARNVRVKAGVVEGDEREEAPPERGGRALLNLGHTFGHALETQPNISPDQDPSHAPLHHGEAVALGLVAAAHTSALLGWLTVEQAGAVRAAVRAAGLPDRVARLPADAEIVAAMAHDKKAAGGRLRLVLLRSLGQAAVASDPPAEAVLAGLAAIRA